MRILVVTIFFFSVAAIPVLASSKRSTDAELDGFKGAVKSVSTAIEQVERHSDISDHPVIIYPAWCRVCEYDEEGNSLKRGQTFEGRFVGDTTRYVRNEDGTIREKVVMNEKGQVFQRITLGPFGKMEEEDYREGILQDRQTFHYDESGNLIEWLTFAANGNETASTTATFDEEGNVTEQFDRGPENNFLHFTKHFNPNTGVETFTNYNEDGTVRLTFTDKDNHITNYWQQPSDKHEYGSGGCFNTAPKERRCEDHYPDGKVWHQVEKFADERWHNPLRVELRDETEQMQMTADYEYELDSGGNWIKRSVWISTRESGERQLLEIDSRTLSYWK